MILGLLVGGFFVARYADVLPDSFGDAGVHVLSGAGSGGEKSISASNDTKIVSANTARQYIEICKSSPLSTGTFSLAVNSSASIESKITLNANRPCFISDDSNLVTGGFWGIASPSAASVSYQEF